MGVGLQVASANDPGDIYPESRVDIWLQGMHCQDCRIYWLAGLPAVNAARFERFNRCANDAVADALLKYAGRLQLTPVFG